MMGGKSKLVLGAAGALALASVALNVRAYSLLAQHEARPPYKAWDVDVVNLAFATAAHHEDVAVEDLKRMLYATVIHFPGRRCVQLAPISGATGGHKVYCFAEGGNQVVEHHSVGE
jgi:hypothetical protein